MGSAVRRLLVGVALAFIPVVLLAQQPTFKAGTQIVPLYVTVQDIEKRLVPDLVKEDFDVLDNGVPVTLTLFQNEPEPFSVVVMLDTSGSMTLTIDLLQEAAEQFVIRLMPADKGIVGAFNDKIQFPIADFTSSRDDLVGGIREVDYGNSTRLWDAVEASIEQLKRVSGRRVVLVFTDGDDTASKIGLGKVMDEARAAETMVYSIGLQSVYFNGQRQVRSQPDRGTAEDLGRDRRRVLRAEAYRRSRSHVHAGGAGAAQSVRAWLRACHRRQAAQAGSAREETGNDGSGAQVLPGAHERHAISACRVVGDQANAAAMMSAASRIPVTSSALPENVQSKRFMMIPLSSMK